MIWRSIAFAARVGSKYSRRKAILPSALQASLGGQSRTFYAPGYGQKVQKVQKVQKGYEDTFWTGFLHFLHSTA